MKSCDKNFERLQLSEYELYCSLVEEGEIEIFDFYGNADDKIRFLKKWKAKYHNDYTENEISLYIGRHNHIGDFYECMEDFCSPIPGEKMTSQKKLIYEILKDRGEIRTSEEEEKMLEYCCKQTGKTKTEIVREGIREVYYRLKK